MNKHRERHEQQAAALDRLTDATVKNWQAIAAHPNATTATREQAAFWATTFPHILQNDKKDVIDQVISIIEQALASQDMPSAERERLTHQLEYCRNDRAKL